MVRKFELPEETTEWQERALFEAITHDKKARGNRVKLIVLNKIGEATILPTPLNELMDYLKKEEK